MENRRNVNAIGTQNGHYMASDDIMNRRLKNRERQRRYRERKKKIEADSMKVFISNQSTRPQEVIESIGNHYNYINRVHCKRNWKKDARRAQACKNLQETPGIPIIFGSALKMEGQMHSLIPQITELERKNRQVEAASSFSGNETKAIHSARDWKAEARRKKN